MILANFRQVACGSANMHLAYSEIMLHVMVKS